MRPRVLHLFVALGGGALSCGGQSVAPDPAKGPVPVVRLRAEPHSFTFYSGLTDRQRLVVRDAVTWTQVWDRIWHGRSPVPELPQIDFAGEMVVVAALGQRPTGGYDILVDSAEANQEGLTVRVRTISPGRTCMVTQALTQPVDIARLPRTEGAVRFEDRAEARVCP